LGVDLTNQGKNAEAEKLLREALHSEEELLEREAQNVWHA
jgi:hypothetical protein